MDNIIFPGRLSSDILELANKYYATTTMGSKIVPRSGYGAIITDEDGYKYIDLHCDAGVNNLGHCHPKIVEAIQKQAAQLIFAENHNAPNRNAMVLAYLLATKSPVKKPSKVFFANSGAEANEAMRSSTTAYRIFRSKEPARTKVIYFKNGFSGRTKGVKAGSTSKPEVQSKPFLDHCDVENSVYMTFPRNPSDIDIVKKELSEIDSRHGLKNIDRLLIEIPCQGEGGINPVDESCLKYLYERTQEAGIFFVSDCVQTGMGRVGTVFGCDVFPWLKPDILVLGKALAGGLPNGEIIFRSDLDWPKKGLHSNTFGGGPLVAASALAFLSEVERVLKSGRCEIIADTLESGLTSLYKYEEVVDVRGRGAMWAIEFKSDGFREKIVENAEMLAVEEGYGLRLLTAGRRAVRIMPPLVITDRQLFLALDLLEKAIKKAL